MSDPDSGALSTTSDEGCVTVRDLPLTKPRDNAIEVIKKHWETFRRDFESKFAKFGGEPRFDYGYKNKVFVRYWYSNYARKVVCHLNNRQLFSEVTVEYVLKCEFEGCYNHKDTD